MDRYRHHAVSPSAIKEAHEAVKSVTSRASGGGSHLSSKLQSASMPL